MDIGQDDDDDVHDQTLCVHLEICTVYCKEAFPTDIDPPKIFQREKNMFIFHDKSTFNANDDESLQWGSAESQVIRPKSRGSGIMVSDIVTEHDGYLCLTQTEFDSAKESNQNGC